MIPTLGRSVQDYFKIYTKTTVIHKHMIQTHTFSSITTDVMHFASQVSKVVQINSELCKSVMQLDKNKQAQKYQTHTQTQWRWYSNKTECSNKHNQLTY